MSSATWSTLLLTKCAKNLTGLLSPSVSFLNSTLYCRLADSLLPLNSVTSFATVPCQPSRSTPSAELLGTWNTFTDFTTLTVAPSAMEPVDATTRSVGRDRHGRGLLLELLGLAELALQKARVLCESIMMAVRLQTERLCRRGSDYLRIRAVLLEQC